MPLAIFFSDISSLIRCLDVCIKYQSDYKPIILTERRKIVVLMRRKGIPIFLITDRKPTLNLIKLAGDVKSSTSINLNNEPKTIVLELKDDLITSKNIVGYKSIKIDKPESFISLVLNFSILPCLFKQNNSLFAILKLGGEFLIISTETISAGDYLLVDPFDLTYINIEEETLGSEMINYALFAICDFNTINDVR